MNGLFRVVVAAGILVPIVVALLISYRANIELTYGIAVFSAIGSFVGWLSLYWLRVEYAELEQQYNVLTEKTILVSKNQLEIHKKNIKELESMQAQIENMQRMLDAKDQPVRRL